MPSPGGIVMEDFQDLIEIDNLTDESTRMLASALCEVVRGLNHATRSTAGLSMPATAYTLLGDLREAAAGLVQLSGQVSGYLICQHAAGRLGHDTQADPGPFIRQAVYALACAADAARLLAGQVNAAQNNIAGIHHKPTPTQAAFPPSAKPADTRSPSTGHGPVETARPVEPRPDPGCRPGRSRQ